LFGGLCSDISRDVVARFASRSRRLRFHRCWSGFRRSSTTGSISWSFDTVSACDCRVCWRAPKSVRRASPAVLSSVREHPPKLGDSRRLALRQRRFAARQLTQGVRLGIERSRLFVEVFGLWNQSALFAEEVPDVMKVLSLDEYLSQRRPSYTYEARLLAQVLRDPEFRTAASWTALEKYLRTRNAPFGLRQAAKALWNDYVDAKNRSI